MKFNRCAAVLISAALTVTACCTALPHSLPTALASAASWQFDFGSGDVESGYIGITADTAYSPETGYGFSDGTAVKDVSAPGQGVLSDAVRFQNATATGDHTFCVDVPNGLYQVTVWVGKTARTSIAIEGMYQIMNIDANCACHTLQVPVTDGQFNLCACAGKLGPYTVAALELTQISAQTHTNPTVWVCGDSTVCNYYPIDTAEQLAGWAQLLPGYIDGSRWQVMNMATSGQYAEGFLKAGQFTVIAQNGQPGDIFVIAMGINDFNHYDEDEYDKAVTYMAKTALERGMRVILVKQQGRAGDIELSPLLTERWFSSALDRIGAQLGVEVVDLFTLWQDFRLSIGDTVPSPYYRSGDDLHFNRKGAAVLAELMAAAIMGEVFTPEPETTQPPPDTTTATETTAYETIDFTAETTTHITETTTAFETTDSPDTTDITTSTAARMTETTAASETTASETVDFTSETTTHITETTTAFETTDVPDTTDITTSTTARISDTTTATETTADETIDFTAETTTQITETTTAFETTDSPDTTDITTSTTARMTDTTTATETTAYETVDFTAETTAHITETTTAFETTDFPDTTDLTTSTTARMTETTVATEATRSTARTETTADAGAGERIGDVNRDSVCSIADAVLLCRLIAELEPGGAADLAAADVNSDGIVDLLDVRVLLRHLHP